MSATGRYFVEPLGFPSPESKLGSSLQREFNEALLAHEAINREPAPGRSILRGNLSSLHPPWPAHPHAAARGNSGKPIAPLTDTVQSINDNGYPLAPQVPAHRREIIGELARHRFGETRPEYLSIVMQGSAGAIGEFSQALPRTVQAHSRVVGFDVNDFKDLDR